ncbi:MAG: hypothetical protein AAB229_08625 [Candidatus Hydrogenedentota bacterium]
MRTGLMSGAAAYSKEHLRLLNSLIDDYLSGGASLSEVLHREIEELNGSRKLLLPAVLVSCLATAEDVKAFLTTFRCTVSSNFEDEPYPALRCKPWTRSLRRALARDRRIWEIFSESRYSAEIAAAFVTKLDADSLLAEGAVRFVCENPRGTGVLIRMLRDHDLPEWLVRKVKTALRELVDESPQPPRHLLKRGREIFRACETDSRDRHAGWAIDVAIEVARMLGPSSSVFVNCERLILEQPDSVESDIQSLYSPLKAGQRAHTKMNKSAWRQFLVGANYEARALKLVESGALARHVDSERIAMVVSCLIPPWTLLEKLRGLAFDVLQSGPNQRFEDALAAIVANWMKYAEPREVEQGAIGVKSKLLTWIIASGANPAFTDTPLREIAFAGRTDTPSALLLPISSESNSRPRRFVWLLPPDIVRAMLATGDSGNRDSHREPEARFWGK